MVIGKDVVKEEESHGTLLSVETTQAGREGHLIPLSESDTGPNEANLENPDFVHEIDLNNEPFTKPSPTERALNIGQGVGPVAVAAWLEERPAAHGVEHVHGTHAVKHAS